MKYIFNEETNYSIEDRILKINNLTREDIDVSSFNVDYNLEILSKFRNKIIESKNNKFLIVGDYDCDGICATAIIKRLLDKLNIKNNFYIPSRSKEGYGINNMIVDNAKNNDFDCIICVDNGIIAYEQLSLAKSYGIKTFVIDHHEYQELPNCDALLHPNLFPKKYSDMCAGGLCSLLANSFEYDEINTVYGGLATLADMVSVLNYNRYLIKEMLNVLSNTRIEPIYLMLNNNEISCKSLQFNVIPKINAVSRLEELMNVNYVVKFLLSNGRDSLAYYDKIEIINNARKNYSKDMYEYAIKDIDDSSKIIILKSTEYKEGLCGILANRIMENYHKPTIVLSQNDKLLKGSGRSIPGCNLYEYLRNIETLFDSYGGHEFAVGLTIKSSKYDEFISYIQNNDLIYEEVYKDVIVLDNDDITFDFFERISSLAPFGTLFKEPLFAIKSSDCRHRYVIKGKYPKFDINDSLTAISFNSNHLNKEFKYMIGRIQKDNYSHNSLSFVIEDLV